MNWKGVIVLIGLVCVVEANDENYCDPTLCEDGLTHTACDHYLVGETRSNFVSRKCYN